MIGEDAPFASDESGAEKIGANFGRAAFQCIDRIAIAAGADRASLQTVDVEDMPLAYLPGNALRVRVRVAGEMASPRPAQPAC